MFAFRKNLKASAEQDPWPPVGFDVGQALWRDSASLFRSMSDVCDRPKLLNWLDALVEAGWIDAALTLPIDAMGLKANPERTASVVLWRHERLPLPLVYLREKSVDLVGALRDALQRAEMVGGELGRCAGLLAELIVAPDSDQHGGRQPNAAAAARLRARLTAEPAFWARLEVPFKQLVVDLPRDVRDVEEGVVEYGANAKPGWARLLREIALKSFGETVDGLDAAPRSAKAVAKAEQRLRMMLGRILKDWLKPGEVMNIESID